MIESENKIDGELYITTVIERTSNGSEMRKESFVQIILKDTSGSLNYLTEGEQVIISSGS